MDLSLLLNGDVDHLPPFANDYNKQLDREIKEQEKHVRGLANNLSDVNQRVDVMAHHMRNIQQELQTSQNLHDARVREAETETHLRLLSEREMGKLRVELEAMNAKQNELKEKLNVIQNTIFKTSEKVEEFRQQMNWNKDQLDQWVSTEKQKEEDNLSLLRYTKADDAKIKEFSFAIDKLIKEGIRKKSELDAEITETRAAQIQLDKTGEAFRQLHQERQELIRQWEEAIEAMRKRDVAILQADEVYASLKSEVGGKQEILRERAKFLDEQKANNVQIENKIAQADRQLAKIRAQYSQAQHSIVEYQDEVETLRNTVSKTVTTLEAKKNEVLFLRKDILDKRARLERVRVTHYNMSMQLKNEFAKTDSLDARAKQLETYHKQEEQKNKLIDKELADLKQQMFKHSQEMFQLKQKEANLLSEINGSSAASKNLQSNIHKLDAETVKQMELVYNQEYQLQLLERKISRASGERSNEEKAVLNERINQLTKDLDSETQKAQLLGVQLKKIEDDVKATRRRVEAAAKERERLDGKIHELTLDNDSAQRSLKAVVKTKEELLITENFVRLDVKRLRDLLYRKADEVFNLGNRKLQLRLAMEERQSETAIHRDTLRAQLKGLEEEKHSLVRELKDAEARVDNLKKKYELHLFRFAPQQDETEERTQAYYVIKAAQEKEELQRVGDELDAEIGRSEKEIRGLVNTLNVLNAQNERLHSGRSRADLTKEETELQRTLEEEFSEARKVYDQKQKQIDSLKEEIEMYTVSMSAHDQDTQELNGKIGSMIARRNMLERELSDQKAKLQRARQQFIKMSKAYKQRKGIPDNDETVYEKELTLHDKKEQNYKKLYALAQLARNRTNDDTFFALTKMAAELGLSLPDPPTPVSRQSNRSISSSASSFSPFRPSTLSSLPPSRPASTLVFDKPITPITTPSKPSSPAGSKPPTPLSSRSSKPSSPQLPPASPHRLSSKPSSPHLPPASPHSSKPSSPLLSPSSSTSSLGSRSGKTRAPLKSPSSSVSRPPSKPNMSITGLEISASRPGSKVL